MLRPLSGAPLLVLLLNSTAALRPRRPIPAALAAGGWGSSEERDTALVAAENENCRKHSAVPARSVVTPGMGRIQRSAFVQEPPREVPEQNASVKLALLMFVKDRILNSDLWSDWLQRGRKDGLDFKVHIHAYGISHANAFASRDFRHYLGRLLGATGWCQMWWPEMEYLKDALKDPTVTHFAVLSQDSLPVKPMRYIYQQLSANASTRMCADDKWNRPWPRAETWWVMRRGDAELFRDHEHTAVRPYMLDECTEEEAWYYPLRARREVWGEERAPVLNECVMFTDWKDGLGCKAWAANVDRCPNACREVRSLNHTPAGYKHPTSFNSLTIPAFQELLNSSFWFARKFADGVVPRDASAMLGAYPEQPSRSRRTHRVRRRRK